MNYKYRVTYPMGSVEFASQFLADEYSEEVGGIVDSVEIVDAAAPAILRQTSRVVILSRLTSAEYEALKSSTDQLVRRFYDAALAQGELVSSDPDLAQAIAYLDHLGIIAASRWPQILAP